MWYSQNSTRPGARLLVLLLWDFCLEASLAVSLSPSTLTCYTQITKPWFYCKTNKMLSGSSLRTRASQSMHAHLVINSPQNWNSSHTWHCTSGSDLCGCDLFKEGYRETILGVPRLLLMQLQLHNLGRSLLNWRSAGSEPFRLFSVLNCLRQGRP